MWLKWPAIELVGKRPEGPLLYWSSILKKRAKKRQEKVQKMLKILYAEFAKKSLLYLTLEGENGDSSFSWSSPGKQSQAQPKLLGW